MTKQQSSGIIKLNLKKGVLTVYYKDIETSKDEKRSYNERMAANARERLAKNAANKSKK